MRFLSVFLFSLFSVASSFSSVDAGTLTAYKEEGCTGSPVSIPFSGTDYCLNLPDNGGSMKFTCFDPTNANPPYSEDMAKAWPKQAMVLLNQYTEQGCSASSNIHQIAVTRPNFCIGALKVQCDTYTAQLPADSLNWYAGNIGIVIQNTQQRKQCPASQSLFSSANPQYVRSIVPLDTCLPEKDNKNGYLGTKVACTPGRNATIDPPTVAVIQYSDRQCNTPIKTETETTGCATSEESGTVSRYQCRLNGEYTNDNYVYIPSSAYGNNYWNPLVVVGSALMGLFLFYAN